MTPQDEDVSHPLATLFDEGYRTVLLLPALRTSAAKFEDSTSIRDRILASLRWPFIALYGVGCSTTVTLVSESEIDLWLCQHDSIL